MLKITSAIICYNYGNFLENAILSCINQEKGDYDHEIIVIDDGSTDNTPEICEKYQSQISIYRFSNEGFGSSLTRAIRLAQGDVICLLDADDYFAPNKLKVVAEKLIGSNDILFLYHDQTFIDETGEVLSKIETGGNTSTHIIRRQPALDLLPVLNEQFFYTLFLVGRGIHLRLPLSFYRIHGSNMSTPLKTLNWKRELIKVNLGHLALLNKLTIYGIKWASSTGLTKAKFYVKKNLYFLKMEICLNQEKKIIASKYYRKLIYASIMEKSFSFKVIWMGISYFILGRYKKYKN